jgi:hypothetical protein
MTPVVPERWPDDADARRALDEYLRAPAEAAEIFHGIEMDFRGAVLDGIGLDSAWLNGARLDDVRLRAADLRGARLDGASLRRADLSGALLTRAVLDHADARDAVLDGATLVRAEAYRTDLRGARLRRTRWASALLGCDLRGVDLTEAEFDETAMRGCRIGEAALIGARGTVFGPIDVSGPERGGPEELGGDALERWFRERDAEITVLKPRSKARAGDL